MRMGGTRTIDIDTQVKLGTKIFRLNLSDAKVSIRLDDSATRRLKIKCSACSESCHHMGSACSLLLEEKMALGLSAIRPEEIPLGLMDEDVLFKKALADREARALNEKMLVKSLDPEKVWTDYQVTNRSSGRAYRVGFRGMEPGESYCSCPDYKKNTLGLCKHTLKVRNVVKRRFKMAQWAEPYVRESFEVHMLWTEKSELKFLPPGDINAQELKICGDLLKRPIEDIPDLLMMIRKLDALGRETIIYPDAEEEIHTRLMQERRAGLAADIRRDFSKHPLRKTLLKAELLPHQLDGIAFAFGAGRSVLADDMGLGKTIQGIGLAELLAREVGISKVLVICPASVKAQWRSEIHRFSDRSANIVIGTADERAAQYDSDNFFTICNYEQVLKDIGTIEQTHWDLIILDEGQRIKNWEAKTSRVVKGLHSRFALALTGTPLENRLDDLFSIVEFIDARQLGPAFQFFNKHRVVDEKGRVRGYKKLDEIRANLSPIFLRRTRASVIKDLPPRITSIVRVIPTKEQLELHDAHMRIVQIIIQKPYLTEMDLLRLQKALLMARMTADSTFLATKQPPGSSSKLKRLDELLGELAAEGDRKILLFSEWTTMLNLIEPLLEKNGLQYVRLDGSVPQKKRQQLVNSFQKNPECRVFIATNAGATGLNLQAANTVINIDLPWNPAILEQRIARAHRMGQKNPVQVFILVTEETIEEKLLGTLSAKHELALAALDMNSNINSVSLKTGIDELKRRLEVLLGAEPEALEDESQQQKTAQQVVPIKREKAISRAGGDLLGAAFAFLGEMLPQQEQTLQTQQLAVQIKQSFEENLKRDEDGNLQLTVTLADSTALDNLAQTLARLMPTQ
ncbi:DEAD/DEAH box helicase [Myxococcota bacterium]|nr:DEAD/DEAH box helicase [Myxococcota bacterium]